MVKLVRAAPCSFFSFAEASQVLFASLSHLVMKLFRAAPASFFSAARLRKGKSPYAEPRAKRVNRAINVAFIETSIV